MVLIIIQGLEMGNVKLHIMMICYITIYSGLGSAGIMGVIRLFM